MTYPVENSISTLLTRLEEREIVVLTAPPGSGKSTILPLRLLASGSVSGRMLLLEPRRLAARQVAARMAEQLGEAPGQTIGLHTRIEHAVSDRTRLLVVTEGVLTRMLVSDPTLEGYDLIFFDEFHERSIYTDLGLALARETQRLVRPDLRLLIMSATMDTEALCRELDAPLVEAEGKMYPVALHHRPDADIAKVIREALDRHEGDILVFLPGEKEITTLYERLNNAVLTGPQGYNQRSITSTNVHNQRSITCLPLYGRLSPAEQRQAIVPAAPGTRKIVLSTPIAETSLTIEGVRVVIDSGLYRRPVVDERTGLTRLETAQISMDMAIQRMGRAGRVAEGDCYRLYSAATEARMALTRTPEILTADLASPVLQILAYFSEMGETPPCPFWGKGSGERGFWLTRPDKGRIYAAYELLEKLGALAYTSPTSTTSPTITTSTTSDTSSATLNSLGRRMAAIPAHPRLAKMLLSCHTEADRRLAHRIIDALEEGSRLSTLDSRLSTFDSYDIGRLLAAAYPERIAKHLGNGTYRLASGGNITLDSCSPWAVIIDRFSAVELAESDLTPYIYTRERVAWDPRTNTLVAAAERRVGMIVLDSRPLSKLTPEMRIAAVAEAAPKYGLTMFDFSDEDFVRLQLRLQTLADWHPELNLPDYSTEALLGRVADWYDGTTSDLKHYPLVSAISAVLPLPLLGKGVGGKGLLDALVPSHWPLPNGRRARIDYRPGAAAPVLSARLEDCFGMLDTPRLDGGKRPVLMELLSPGFKPVQLTSDLRSFWTNTYAEVRKELRRRYPKHPWPEDPLG